MDTGSIGANQTYFIFVIKNPSTAVTGYLASTSLASPTLPSGFTLKRWIGAWMTNASSQLRLYDVVGSGETLQYLVIIPVTSVNVANLGITAVTYTIPDVPKGVKIRAKIKGRIGTTSGDSAQGLVSSLFTDNVLVSIAPGGTNVGFSGAGLTTVADSYQLSVVLNESGQYRARGAQANISYSASLEEFEINRSI